MRSYRDAKQYEQSWQPLIILGIGDIEASGKKGRFELQRYRSDRIADVSFGMQRERNRFLRHLDLRIPAGSMVAGG